MCVLCVQEQAGAILRAVNTFAKNEQIEMFPSDSKVIMWSDLWDFMYVYWYINMRFFSCCMVEIQAI